MLGRLRGPNSRDEPHLLLVEVPEAQRPKLQLGDTYVYFYENLHSKLQSARPPPGSLEG